MMENVSPTFCSGVISLLRLVPYETKKKFEYISPSWKLACSAYAENSETLKIIVRPKTTCTRWEYCFVGTKYFSLEEMLKKNRNMTRINNVVFQYGKMAHQQFREISKEELKTQLIPYVAAQLNRFSTLQCDLERSPETEDVLGAFYKASSNRASFTSITMNYQGQASEDFLAAQIEDSASCSVILRGTGWPITVKHHLLTLIAGKAYYLNVCETDIDLDPVTFASIFNLWLKKKTDSHNKTSFPQVSDFTAMKQIRPDLQIPKDREFTGVEWSLGEKTTAETDKHRLGFYVHQKDTYISFH
ncbi:hypothetical protein QR680_011825 [Steinernema hermaphroditum]|uniref:Uncharacterized protein n=1 Tax=Steinernema hermaphroditum TaxID=289476 RepID=A0AA39LYQ8_9BILA|nr:hypothetical protein QR680_011825 [Steinernema hermaphroditum]